MLLIGSRAIRHYFPEFRPPRDWDLVGTEQDIARLDQVLPRTDNKRYPAKANFRMGSVLVEVANASVVNYWARVLSLFESEPILEEPTLGKLRIAPPAYLLLTKQCGLIYRIAHWHKNLEDLYFLRERIPTIPDEIAALLPDATADSRRLFGASHKARATEPWACHPRLPDIADPALHQKLHASLALGTLPVCLEPDAWGGFVGRAQEERRQRMRCLFAEEAMVLAAQHYLCPIPECPSEDAAELIRWALRSLITSGLPEGWRYFGVNHYREIRDMIPPDWMNRLVAIPRAESRYTLACHGRASACDPLVEDAR